MNNFSPLKYGAIGAIIASVLAGGLAIASLATLETGTIKVGASGSTYDYVGSVTTSVDVASLTTFLATTTVVSVPGASVGDQVLTTVISGDFFGSTSTARLGGRVTSADNVTLTFQNASSATINYGPSVFGITVLSQ